MLCKEFAIDLVEKNLEDPQSFVAKQNVSKHFFKFAQHWIFQTAQSGSPLLSPQKYLDMSGYRKKGF